MGDEDDRRGWGLTTGTTTEGDRRRGVVLPEREMRIQAACVRKKKLGAICFFYPGSNGRLAHIRWPGLDRPKVSAGAPAPISALTQI